MQAQPSYYPEAPETGVIVLDEEWQRQTEISERRKAQNRLAQRNFRKRRSQQQQQAKQQQDKDTTKQDPSSKSASYPSPRPSPQSSYRSVKSPERDSISRGSGSRERSGSSSQSGSLSSPGSATVITPQSMLSNDFLPLEEEGLNAVDYQSNQGHVNPNSLSGPYQGHFDHSISPVMMNHQMQFEPGMYDPQFSMPMYGSPIRPAIIPRTEGSGLSSSPHSNSSFRNARKPSSAGSMSIDLNDPGSMGYLRQGLMSPGSQSVSTTPHGLSPGLNSCGRGEMSLHLSAEKGHEGVVRLLLDCGADINARDDYGSTPLHLAAKYGQETVVQALLDRGADVNAKNANGWSAVHIASKYGHENILRQLIQRGADLNAKAKDDKQKQAASVTGQKQ